MMKSQVYQPDTFLYFAYGANIFAFRMHMHSPNAEFVSIARADAILRCDIQFLARCFRVRSLPYLASSSLTMRLDFIHYHKFWGGPEATMVPTANAHVWGVIWRLHTDDMVSLDDVKGVNVKKYYIKYIPVLTPYMGYFNCRAYIQKVNPLPRGDKDLIPVERWPSWDYKQVMIMGATEHTFPPYYIELLKNLKDNGEEGCLRTTCLLTRYGRDAPCPCRVPGRVPRRPLKMDNTHIKLHKLRKLQKM